MSPSRPVTGRATCTCPSFGRRRQYGRLFLGRALGEPAPSFAPLLPSYPLATTSRRLNRSPPDLTVTR
jgi:hypothetical protein